MLKQIDKTLSYDYSFSLCRRDNRQIIATLKDGYNASNFVYKPEFKNIDEISFEVPFYVRDYNNLTQINPVWDKLKADMLILMEVSIGDEQLFKEYFIVGTPKNIGGEEKKKTVDCLSYEQSLNNIHLRAFEGTRQLYKFGHRYNFTNTNSESVIINSPKSDTLTNNTTLDINLTISKEITTIIRFRGTYSSDEIETTPSANYVVNFDKLVDELAVMTVDTPINVKINDENIYHYIPVGEGLIFSNIMLNKFEIKEANVKYVYHAMSV